MAKFRIIHEKEICIGCGACAAVCPAFWQMGDDGKSHVKGAKTLKQNEMKTQGVTVNEVLDLDNLDCNQQAADCCPVNCIHVKNRPLK
jgi:ferredoxin